MALKNKLKKGHQAILFFPHLSLTPLVPRIPASEKGINPEDRSGNYYISGVDNQEQKA